MTDKIVTLRVVDGIIYEADRKHNTKVERSRRHVQPLSAWERMGIEKILADRLVVVPVLDLDPGRVWQNFGPGLIA